MSAEDDSKPGLWMGGYQDALADSVAWVADFHAKLRMNFTLLTPKHIVDKPELATRVLGAVVSPRHQDEFREQFHLLTNLKVVSTFSVGYNHIDLNLLKKHNILLANCPGGNNEQVADMAMGLLIASARDICKGALVEDVNIYGADVTGSVIGIVGLGHIGYEVSRRARAFSMKVLYHSRKRRLDDHEVGATYCSQLADMLPQCDYLVLSCPLNNDTEKIINKTTLSMMKIGSTLINISRGGVVDTDALVEALQSGHLRGAGMDVTEPYRLPEGHPLLRMPQVILTHHRAALTQQSCRNVAAIVIHTLEAALIHNKKIPHEVEL